VVATTPGQDPLKGAVPTRGAVAARMATLGESGSILFHFFSFLLFSIQKLFYKIFSKSFGSVFKTFFALF
jgi:hypothetical protein